MARSENKKADYVFLAYVLAILVFGLIMLMSASNAVGLDRFDDKYFFIKRQLLLGVLPGIVAFLVFAKIDYRHLKKLSFGIFATSIVLLLLVFIPGLGTNAGTFAKSWINIAGFTFQPAEFAKLALIIYMAAYLSERKELLGNFKEGFLVALGLGSIPIVLIMMQPDTGTVFIIAAILFALLFLAGSRLSHLGVLALIGIVGFSFIVLTVPRAMKRVETFLHPELDPLGQGYQINQAFLAIGTGGLFGMGLGHSRQKFLYLPEVHADSIFAVIAEEMGFFLVVGFLALYMLMIFRGLFIAKYAPDPFARLLVSGIVLWFGIQAILNIGAMVGILPLTGVPLPFVSHGGTSLMVALAAIGIIANVSKHSSLPTRV